MEKSKVKNQKAKLKVGEAPALEKVVVANANRVPQSALKVRVVAGAVKGMPLNKALAALTISRKKAAKSLYKVIFSAIANAKNNFKLDQEDLSIRAILVGEGPSLKRLRPAAKGQGNQIIKRTSNIRVILAAQEQSK